MERHEGKSIITYFLNFLCLIYEDGKVDLIKEGIRVREEKEREKKFLIWSCAYISIYYVIYKNIVAQSVPLEIIIIFFQIWHYGNYRFQGLNSL